MVDVGVGLQPAERRHGNAARRADPGQVVAQQIDDHDVLGPLLDRGQQRRGGRPVGLRVVEPAGGALDRAGLDVAAVQPDEALGRGRRDRQPLLFQVGPEGRRIGRAQAPVERERIEARRQIRSEALGDVGLVDVAGPDIGANLFDGVLIALPVEIRAPRELVFESVRCLGRSGPEPVGECGEPRLGAGLPGGGLKLGKAGGDEPGRAGGVVDHQGRVVEVEGDVVGEPRPPGRDGDPLQRRAEVVGEIADRPAGKGIFGAGGDPVGREAGPQGREGATRNRAPVEGRAPVAEAEACERVGGHDRMAPQRIVPHGAVEEGEPRQRPQPGRRRDGIDEGNLSGPHDRVRG